MKPIGMILLGAALVVSACSAHTARPSRPATTGPSFYESPSGTASPAGPGLYRLPQAAVSREENVPSALDDPTAKGLPKLLVDPKLIIDGGPPPDGIPPSQKPSSSAPTPSTG